MVSTSLQNDRSLGDLAKQVARFIGYLIAALGLIVLVGWVLDIPALKSVLPGLATMKFNTALLFLLSGLSLVTHSTHRRAAQVCANGVILIAGLSLAEYLFGWDFGIDELFIRDLATVAQNGPYPGRMSVMTAVNFFLLGSSLLLLNRRVLLSQNLALPAAFLSFLALAGYMYGVEALYGIIPYSSMALHTALAFFLLSGAVLAADTDTKIMRIVVSNSAGGLLIRRLLPAAVLVPLFLGWARFLGQHLGLYENEFGAALATVINIAIFSVIVSWTARKLHRIDLQRLQAETLLRQANDELEMRVEARTAELAAANDELRRSEARFAGVLETAHDGVISVDEQQRIILFNHGAERIFGYLSEDIIGQPLDQLLPEYSRAYHSSHITDFGRSGDSTRIMAPDRTEVRGLRKSGQEFPADVSISSLVLDGQRIFTAVVRDATERMQATQALAASEQRFSLLVNTIRDYAIYMIDTDGNVASWNQGAERIKGYKAEEIIGKSFAQFYTQEDIARGEPERILQVAADEGHFSDEGWHVRKDGTQFWARVDISALRDMQGHLLGYSKVTQDLTEPKQAEDAIRQSEALLRQVLQMLPVGVWITDASGNITIGNPAGEQIWAGAKYVGVEQYGEYKGWWLDTGEIIAPDEWAAARAVTKGETSINEEIEIECFDGTHKYMLNSGIPIRDERQNIIGAIIVNQDITASKRAEAQLREYADALERSNQELQRFVYTASHDLQEPLRKIQAFGDRLQNRNSSQLDEQGRDYLERMINASTRMKALIEDLLAYSRVTTMTRPFAQVDLNVVINQVRAELDLVIETTHAKIEVEPLATIAADESQMRQLFQNLLSNALKFRAESRDPMIRISGRILDGLSSNSSVTEKSALHYEVVVTDNGIGFEEKYSDRIFGMFQRLHGRSEYEGTGVGLAICQKIVEKHHGTIAAHGALNQGASFVITLPVQQTDEKDV